MKDAGSIYQRKSDGRWVAAVSAGPRGARTVRHRYATTREGAERGLRELRPDYDDPWRNVDRTGDCWLWLGATSKQGYGLIWTGAGRSGAHRVIYEREIGPIPPGRYVCHRCDNPPCVRPDHLFAGTQTENMRDMIAKGRWVRQSP